MQKTVLTISSKNYGSWSLRGWLLVKFAGLPFEEETIPPDDPDMRAEMLLLSPSILVPRLTHEGIPVWDTLAIAEYLHEVAPQARLLPADRAMRAHCRAICGEIHSGFAALRSALPMNLKSRFPGFKLWSRAQADIDRIVAIWRDCLARYGGPYLFGERSMAEAMESTVVSDASMATGSPALRSMASPNSGWAHWIMWNSATTNWVSVRDGAATSCSRAACSASRCRTSTSSDSMPEPRPVTPANISHMASRA